MPFYIPGPVADNIVASLAILAGTIVFRLAGEAYARRVEDPAVARRRRYSVRAFANGALVVALAIVWLSQLHTLALSLAAVLVALVIATKELLMCAAGSALRIGGHLFKIGDRIEVGSIRGEVIDHGLFSTTIMEVPAERFGHAGTGRTVMLPNSILLTGTIKVAAQPRQFAPHRFTMTLEDCASPRAALAAIEAAAARVLADDMERASRFHRMTAGKAGTDIAGPGSRVSVSTSELGKLQFDVMIYCLVRDAHALEQTIVVDALETIAAARRDERAAHKPQSAPRSPAEDRAWAQIAEHLKALPERDEPQAQANGRAA